MFCNYCGQELNDNALFCVKCGKAVPGKKAAEPVAEEPAVAETPIVEEPAVVAAPIVEEPVPAPAPVYETPAPQYTAPQYQSAPAASVQERIVEVEKVPEQNAPLSPWAYFGLQILFSIPVVGFVFLIVFSCNGSNINRRNFARSYWCALLIVAVIVVIALVVMLAMGGMVYGARSSYYY